MFMNFLFFKIFDNIILKLNFILKLNKSNSYLIILNRLIFFIQIQHDFDLFN